MSIAFPKIIAIPSPSVRNDIYKIFPNVVKISSPLMTDDTVIVVIRQVEPQVKEDGILFINVESFPLFIKKFDKFLDDVKDGANTKTAANRLIEALSN